MPYKDPSRQRQYHLDRWHAKRREAIALLGGKCVECGSTGELEVDHKDPALKVSSNFWCWSKARRDEELAKCQVLCSRCHLAKTSAYMKTDPRLVTTPSHKSGCICAVHKRARQLEAVAAITSSKGEVSATAPRPVRTPATRLDRYEVFE